MGMNAFAVFTGAGLGPLAFGCLFGIGFSGALIIFSLAEVLLGIFAIPLLRGEDASAEKAH